MAAKRYQVPHDLDGTWFESDDQEVAEAYLRDLDPRPGRGTS